MKTEKQWTSCTEFEQNYVDLCVSRCPRAYHSGAAMPQNRLNAKSGDDIPYIP